jgi:hypothetical protein
MHKKFKVKTHGHSRYENHSKTYKVWAGMKKRCSTPSMTAYKYYGGRGISVCERWNSFDNFLADMGETPEGMSLDRIDSDGNYEPLNCRWASPKAQARNRRNAVRVTAFGETLTLPEWVEKTGLSYRTIYGRLRVGTDPELALSRKWYSREHQKK